MSNFFEEVLDDVNAVEEKLLGPDCIIFFIKF